LENETLELVYGAKTLQEQEAAYDVWAADYERDLFAMAYRLPYVGAALLAREIRPEAGPILDAGCGTGMACESLALLGYGPITGIDLSDKMLSLARHKGIYADLRKMTLGEPLDLPKRHFAGMISIGTFTPGHAPAEALADLAALVRPGGTFVLSLRVDAQQEPAYAETCQRLESEGTWRQVYESPSFPPMPLGEPEVMSRLYAFEIV